MAWLEIATLIQVPIQSAIIVVFSIVIGVAVVILGRSATIIVSGITLMIVVVVAVSIDIVFINNCILHRATINKVSNNNTSAMRVPFVVV